jgi:hypothetical protein
MSQPVENSEKAAAGFLGIETLKTALTGIHRELVFDDSFYPKARAYLDAQGFDEDYLSWLYEECRKREPDSLRGLYFTLFAKEDIAALYRAVKKERCKAKAPDPEKICPACGTAHPACLERCHECELEKADEGDPAKVARQRKFHRLPREAKDEYAKEQWALFSEALKSRTPFEEVKAQWIMLDKKYRLGEKWRGIGERLRKGRLEQDKWERDGRKHSGIKIAVDRVKLLGKAEQTGAEPDAPDVPLSEDIETPESGREGA